MFESVKTLVHVFGDLARHHHLAILGGIELVAGLLFLWPRTLRIGGWVLVVIFLFGVLLHGLRGEFMAPLLVYAAAALYVTLHGGAWRLERGQRALSGR